MPLIYIVEDDENIREIETIALKNSNYIVSAFEKAKDFYKKLDDIIPDLVLLDVMLPDESGYDIVKKLRKNSATKRLPIIMVTAKTTEIDKVKGLDNGADDYMTKPFAIEELLARIRLILKKQTKVVTEKPEHALSCNKLVMDPDAYEVRYDGELVELTHREFELLKVLLENKNIVVNRDTLLQKVCGYDYMGETNLVDVYVRHIRNKLDEKYDVKMIKTVRGVGYVIKDE